MIRKLKINKKNNYKITKFKIYSIKMINKYNINKKIKYL